MPREVAELECLHAVSAGQREVAAPDSDIAQHARRRPGDLTQLLALRRMTAPGKNLLDPGALLQQSRDKSRVIELLVLRHGVLQVIVQQPHDLGMNGAAVQLLDAAEHVEDVFSGFPVRAR